MITEHMQKDLIDLMKDHFAGSVVKTFEKYDGQLAVDDVRNIAINCPALLVFYNGGEYVSEVSGRPIYQTQALFEILVCSDNIASKDSMSDEVLMLKDKVIDALKDTAMKIANRSYTIQVVRDRILIREPGLSVCGVVVLVKGLN